jgi:hypothetical protein
MSWEQHKRPDGSTLASSALERPASSTRDARLQLKAELAGLPHQEQLCRLRPPPPSGIARLDAPNTSRTATRARVEAGFPSGAAEAFAVSVSDGFPEASEGHPGFPAQLGQTDQESDWILPKLEIHPEKGDDGYVAKVEPTTSQDGNHTAIAAPAGKHEVAEYPLKVPLLEKLGREKTARMVKVYAHVEAETLHPKVVQGEQEHLDDLAYAYEISLKRAETVINEAAEQEFTGSSKKKAEKAAENFVLDQLPDAMQDEDDWSDVCLKLGKLSGDRDEAGWHHIEYASDKNNEEHTKRWKWIVPDDIDEGEWAVEVPYIDYSDIGSHDSDEVVSFDKLKG